MFVYCTSSLLSKHMVQYEDNILLSHTPLMDVATVVYILIVS